MRDTSLKNNDHDGVAKSSTGFAALGYSVVEFKVIVSDANPKIIHLPNTSFRILLIPRHQDLMGIWKSAEQRMLPYLDSQFVQLHSFLESTLVLTHFCHYHSNLPPPRQW